MLFMLKKPWVKYIPILFVVASCFSNGERDAHQSHIGGHAKSVNYADSINAGLIPKDTLKGSPARISMEHVGGNHVHIRYGSPGVRGRVIWGGLVGYDEVWATGAHNATSIDFSKDVVIEGKTIPAGKYGFFTMPGKEEWTLILNKNWEQHLADEYSVEDDVLRLTIKPEFLDEVTQRLTYSIEKESNLEGKIVMRWEKIRVTLPFKNLQP
jgi:hypothetical protein